MRVSLQRPKVLLIISRFIHLCKQKKTVSNRGIKDTAGRKKKGQYAEKCGKKGVHYIKREDEL